MAYNAEVHHRKSIRLKGWDYSTPGGYFVTICTRNRACIFGDIVEGQMRLSDLGKIVEECWIGIPGHFPNTRIGVFQVMPNHLDGILKIRETRDNLRLRHNLVGVEYIQPRPNGRKMGKCATQTTANLGRGLIIQTPTEDEWILMKHREILLGMIVRSFKANCTRLIHKAGQPSFKWQRNYYDHIIRDDIDHFFTERYIELNPLMWDLDSENPFSRTISVEDLRRYLKERHGLKGLALDRILAQEILRSSESKGPSFVAPP